MWTLVSHCADQPAGDNRRKSFVPTGIITRLASAKLEGGYLVNLSAPTQPIFIVSLVLFVLALLAAFGVLPFLAAYGFWLAILAYIVLLVGNVAKGL